MCARPKVIRTLLAQWAMPDSDATEDGRVAMCSWTIAGEQGYEAIGIEMLHPTALAVTQGEAKLVISPKQLRGLADKLFFLNEIYRADLQEALECLL
jgi:hypothetical protein